MDIHGRGKQVFPEEVAVFLRFVGCLDPQTTVFLQSGGLSVRVDVPYSETDYKLQYHGAEQEIHTLLPFRSKNNY